MNYFTILVSAILYSSKLTATDFRTFNAFWQSRNIWIRFTESTDKSIQLVSISVTVSSVIFYLITHQIIAYSFVFFRNIHLIVHREVSEGYAVLCSFLRQAQATLCSPIRRHLEPQLMSSVMLHQYIRMLTSALYEIFTNIGSEIIALYRSTYRRNYELPVSQ